MKISADNTGKIIWNIVFNKGTTIAVEYKSVDEAREAFINLVKELERIIEILGKGKT